MTLPRVQNDSVWHSLKVLFTGSLLLFLVNIFFGIDNAFTAGEIPRWQVLIHLHGGSVGWITLSSIGVAIWVLTGQRSVDAGYERKVRGLVWTAIVVFAGYVPTFGLAFSRPSGFLVTLLPIFGVCAVLVLWVCAFFAFSQFKHQSVLTTVHLLAAGTLLTAAIGATVGMLLGMERAVGQFLPLPAGDRVGAHAGMMDTNLFLLASLVVEWSVRKEESRWTWPGLLQAVLWMFGAALVPIAFFLNIVPQVLPVFGLALLGGLALFLGRYAWRALASIPTGSGIRSWAFFGTAWLIVYMALFLYLVATGADFISVPAWFITAFAHAGFVGMMTNILMGVVASRAAAGASVVRWGETAALWLINGGILVFVGMKAAADVRHGALVMAVGVLIGVYTMFRRLRAS